MARKYIFFSLLILILLVPALSFAQDAGSGRYSSVIMVQETSAGPYNLNLYQIVHFVYMYIMVPFSLNEAYSVTSQAKFVKQILDNLNSGNNILIQVKEFRKGQDLLFKLEFIQVDETGYMAVKLSTNYDIFSQVFTSLENPQGGNYQMAFYIEGDKFVALDKVYKKDKEKAFLADENFNNLADMYIFDEKAANDALIEKLLLKNIESLGDSVFRIASYLTLTQYYMMVGDVIKAVASFNKAKAIMDSNPPEKEDFQFAYGDIGSELAIYQAMLKAK